MVFLKIFLTCVLFFSSPALAHDGEHSETMIIEQPYAFSTAVNAKTGAVFMNIKNTGDTDDKLIEVTGNVAEIIELHENIIDPDDGTMMMRKIKDISIDAGSTATLDPKGKHIMLIKLNQDLQVGYQIPLTLVFEKAGEVHIIMDVIAPGTTPEKKETEVSDKDDSDFPEHGFSHESHHF